jgi:hypothetical protein
VQRQLYELRSETKELLGYWCLVYPGKRLYLKFERLSVLPLDLHFGLQFLDKKVKAGDFSPQFLYVSRSGSRSDRRCAWLLHILVRNRCATRPGGNESFGKCSWPNGLWSPLVHRGRRRHGARSRRRRREKIAERVRSGWTFYGRCIGFAFRFEQALDASDEILRLKRFAN